MKNFPLKVASVYLLFALVWITASDTLIDAYFSQAMINKIQLIKGSAFVICTSIVLFIVLSYYNKLIQQKHLDYLKLFSENPNSMWVYDVETKQILLANNKAIEKYDYTLDEFKAMKITDLLPNLLTEDEHTFLKNISTTKEADAGVWVHKSKNDETFYMHMYSHATIFEGKNSRIVNGVDVSDKIKMERNIKASEKKLNALINNSDDIIWLIDKEGAIITGNNPFKNKIKELTSFDMEVLHGINLYHLPTSDFTKNWLSYFDRSLRGEHLNIEEEYINRSTNLKEHFEIVVTPITLDDNELLGVGYFARDVTVRRENENKINQQLNTLKKIAWIQSHELRKPLANIMGLVDLLKKNKEAPADNDQLFLFLEESCQELDKIVKKVVKDSSQIDRTLAND